MILWVRLWDLPHSLRFDTLFFFLLKCGNIIKVITTRRVAPMLPIWQTFLQVTPSSKVVGDFAQWMTSNSFSKEDVIARADQLDFPSSVVEFFQGYLGQPVGGFPEPLRTNIIRNKPRIDGRPGATMVPLDFRKIKADLRSKFGKHISDADVTSYVMYPKVRRVSWTLNSFWYWFCQVFEEYQGFIEKYGDLRYAFYLFCTNSPHSIVLVSFPHAFSWGARMSAKRCTSPLKKERRWSFASWLLDPLLRVVHKEMFGSKLTERYLFWSRSQYRVWSNFLHIGSRCGRWR